VSLRIDIWLPSFTGTPHVSRYTIFDSAGTASLHDVIAANLPSLVSEIEQNLSEFSAGDIQLTCRNDDNGWDTVGFTSENCDPTARFPVCHYIDIYQDGVLVFEGDIDLKTVSFDRKQKTVSFTVLGPLHRLEQWNAEVVRRSVPNLAGAGIADVTGSAGGGYYYLHTATNTWYVDPATAVCEVANHCLIDASGIIWTVVSGWGVAINNRVSALKLGSPRYPPGTDWGKTVSGGPATGSFTIRPMIFASRYDCQSNPASYTLTHTSTSLTDPGKSWATNVWAGYWLEDSAGVFWQIASNTSMILTVTAQGAYPSGPDIAPHDWPGTVINAPTYNIRKSNTLRLLESLGPSIATLGIVGQSASQPGDQLNLTNAGLGAQDAIIAAFTTLAATTQQVEIEFAGPKTTGPPLTAQMLWLMDDIKADLIPTDGVTLATPYYRDKTISQLAALAFAAACGGALTTSVNVVAYADNVVPYADFSQLSVADAIAKLAEVSSCAPACSFSGGPSAPLVTFNFQRRDAGLGALYDLSGFTSDGVTPKIMERQDSIAWEFYYPHISVTGANSAKVQQGSLRYGGTSLDVQSDFMDSYAWLHQVLARLYLYFGSRRAKTTVKVKGDYVVGLQLLGRVRLAGSDEWWPVRISRPLRTPEQGVELDLISSTGVYYTPSDYSDMDPSAVPEPPIVTGVSGSGLNPHVASISWPFPITSLLGFNRRLWGAAGATLAAGVGTRPKDPNFFIGVGGKLTITGTGTFQDAISALDLQIVMYGSPWYVEYEAVLIDGRTSLPSVAFSFS
jgi:hypothetical protein